MRAIEHPLIKALLSLGLPPDDFVIAGSGPLLAHGIRESIGDLDVVADKRAWSKALTLGSAEEAPLYGDQVKRIPLAGGKIEVLNGWFPDIWPTVRMLIEHADCIDGLRYASLKDVLTWKRKHNREKDRQDIHLIELYLQHGSLS